MDENFLDNFTVVDIETTGLSPTTNEIIELSAIKIRQGQVVEKFTTLIKPEGHINSYITNLTGISDEMVKNSPKIEDVIKNFCEFLANDCILGHNINFDLRFIKHNLLKHHNIELNNSSLDTVRLARKYCPKLGSYKLSSLANHFNINTEGHHRALKDCEMTFDLYKKIKACTIENIKT